MPPRPRTSRRTPCSSCSTRCRAGIADVRGARGATRSSSTCAATGCAAPPAAPARRARPAPLCLPSALPSPEEAAQAAEVRTLLLGALAALSPREREAFVLHDLEGADAAETALALGIGESSVRSLLSLARRRLRTLLGPHLAPSGGADA
jgi:RNA polymerase sigma factor (sigma-70 family)